MALPFFAEAVIFAADAVTRYADETPDKASSDKAVALWLMPTLLLWSLRSTSDVPRARNVAERSHLFVQGR